MTLPKIVSFFVHRCLNGDLDRSLGFYDSFCLQNPSSVSKFQLVKDLLETMRSPFNRFCFLDIMRYQLGHYREWHQHFEKEYLASFGYVKGMALIHHPRSLSRSPVLNALRGCISSRSEFMQGATDILLTALTRRSVDQVFASERLAFNDVFKKIPSVVWDSDVLPNVLMLAVTFFAEGCASRFGSSPTAFAQYRQVSRETFDAHFAQKVIPHIFKPPVAHMTFDAGLTGPCFNIKEVFLPTLILYHPDFCDQLFEAYGRCNRMAFVFNVLSVQPQRLALLLTHLGGELMRCHQRRNNNVDLTLTWTALRANKVRISIAVKHKTPPGLTLL